MVGTLAGFAAVVMLASGCSSKSDAKGVAAAPGGNAPASASPPAGGGSMLAYAKCMRDKGITNFPDPNSSGKLDIDGNKVNINATQFKDADQACKPLMPAQGSAEAPPAAVGAAQLKYTKCMRDNGVPKFPDPNAEGGIDINGDTLGVDPNGPVFKGADAKCQHLLTEVGGGPKVVQSGAPGS
jgi:hypothetical protein